MKGLRPTCRQPKRWMAGRVLFTLLACVWGSVRADAGPEIEFSPTALEFGEVAVGDSAAAELLVFNSGDSGLVVSNYRMIYHSQMRVREVKVNEHLRIQLSSVGGRNILKIKSPSWEVKHMAVARADVTRLRDALIQQKFKATWY